MKPPKGVRKAVKAFLGVRKRDVSRWPELDRPVDYKDRLQTSKENYGIDTHELKAEYRDRQRSVSQPPPTQREWQEDRDSAYDQDEDQYLQYAPPSVHHHDWELMAPQLPPKLQQAPPQEQHLPGVEHLKDPWDDHKASTLPGSRLPGPRVGRPAAASTSKDTNAHDPQQQQQQQRGRSMGRKVMTSQTVTGSSKTTDIDERLKSCMSELDRLTSQLDTVVTLTEKLDQMRDEVANADNENNEPISVPYCNQAPHSKPNPQTEHTNNDYHRGIIQGSTAPTPHEEKNNLPPRLPSRTPSNKYLAPPAPPVISPPDHDSRMRTRHHPNKRLHQIQEDNWSSSGYSSGSFESIPSYPPYLHHHDPYATYSPHHQQRHDSYASSMTPSYDPYYQEDTYGEYGMYSPAAPSSDGWYYLTPSSMDGSVSGYRGESVYQFAGGPETYEDWGSYGSYNYHPQQQQQPQQQQTAKSAQMPRQYRMTSAAGGAGETARRFDRYHQQQQQHDSGADSSSSSRDFPARTVSSDSSGKRKTVRFSKTVQERHDEKETTSAMKGSPEEKKKRRRQEAEESGSGQQQAIYEFPEGHIESSCMCDDCILARRSLEQRHQYTYYA